MQPVQGIHHITAFAADPQANVDFYHNLLGQRLVKTTVNFDDPGTYHLYYGDKIGTPGTIMTYFPWPQARRGIPGNGEIGATAYSINAGSVGYWRQRLTNHGLSLGPGESRFGAEVISFRDPAGMALELIVNDDPTTIQPWEDGPIQPWEDGPIQPWEDGPIQPWEDGPISAEHVLRGFHGVTLWLAEAEQTGALLTEQMGYEFVAQAGNRWRYKGAGNDIGLYVDILVDPNRPRGLMGSGSVHHVAFRTRDDSEQLEYQRLLAQAGFGVTEVKDRQYFHSIYFRSPGGVLFEIATDAPGFAADEPVETLGQSLKLPAWLENQRDQIEGILPEFTVKPIEQAPREESIHV